FFHQAGGGAYRGPAHAIVSGDDQAGIYICGVLEDVGKKIGLRERIADVEQSGADGGREFFLSGKCVVVLEKSDGLLGRETFSVFGERLGGDADSFDFE